MSKYPYIADKRMYAAVMGACSYIRDTGYFNKAVSYYADKYGVDENELAKHIRARQSSGQKGKTRKYKYFLIVGWTDKWYNEYDYDILWSQYAPKEWEKERNRIAKIVKATSKENAEKHIPNGFVDGDLRLCGPCVTNCEIAEFDTMEQAKKELSIQNCGQRMLTW